MIACLSPAIPYYRHSPLLCRRSTITRLLSHLSPPHAHTRSDHISIASIPGALMETKEPKPLQVRKLKAIEATPESFAEFGQVISARPDGELFGPQDAQLELHRGTPRFYIMQLKARKLKFSSITHHASVTQCLGSIGGNSWYLGISKASILNPEEIDNGVGLRVVKSQCGHYYVPPHPDNVVVFRISGAKFLKLDAGTWHAGPLFNVEAMDFYNLELSDTNETDHTTHHFEKEDGVVFVIED